MLGKMSLSLHESFRLSSEFCHSNARRCPRCCTASFTSQHSGHTSRGFANYERVLRYPDGKERRIRYPAETVSDLHEQAPPEVLRSFAEDWDPERWGLEIFEGLEVSDLWQAKPSRKRAGSSSTLEEKKEGLPDTPGALLRHLSSASYRKAQLDSWDRVQRSYQVLHESPWVQPRRVYVLAIQGSDSACTYTQRTRVVRSDMQEDLAKVIKRRRADGGPVIRVEEVVDGVITFEQEDDAERFGSHLEAEGHRLSYKCTVLRGVPAEQVLIGHCDSHELFRLVQDVRGVIVYLPHSTEHPLPMELAAALRGQMSLEDSGS